MKHTTWLALHKYIKSNKKVSNTRHILTNNIVCRYSNYKYNTIEMCSFKDYMNYESISEQRTLFELCSDYIKDSVMYVGQSVSNSNNRNKYCFTYS